MGVSDNGASSKLWLFNMKNDHRSLDVGPSYIFRYAHTWLNSLRPENRCEVIRPAMDAMVLPHRYLQIIEHSYPMTDPYVCHILYAIYKLCHLPPIYPSHVRINRPYDWIMAMGNHRIIELNGPPAAVPLGHPCSEPAQVNRHDVSHPKSEVRTSS